MSNRFNGTPGPWDIVPASANCIEIENGNIRICEIVAENDEDLLTELEWNNARLIAAAPDLLDVCMRLRFLGTSTIFQDLEKAIAKAGISD